MTIHDEYLFFQEKFEKKYGKDKTLVLMQIGSFHELYATDTRGPNIKEICELLSITLTRKDKSVDKIDEKNPYMAGFPSVALTKFLNVLMNNNYTVIVIDQVTPPPDPKREITGIYSPTTYVEESFTPDANNLVCLFISDEIQKNGTFLTCIGMSAVDLTTGVCCVHEAYSLIGDEKYALDEAFRFMNSFKPKETIIFRKELPKNTTLKIMKQNELILYLELESKLYKFYNKIEKNYENVNYQKTFLEKIYKNESMLNIFEALDLEKKMYATISFIALLNYAYQQNEKIINNLNVPDIFKIDKHLVLGNNAVQQLNILDSSVFELGNTRIKSLFDVVNNTSTAVGRRYLKYILTTPLLDPNELQTRYECVEECMTEKFYLDIEKHLSIILDIERLHRKISLNMIHPFEFLNLLNSYDEIDRLITKLNNKKHLKKLLPKKIHLVNIKKFMDECREIFNFDELKKYQINEIENSFFNKGYSNEIEKIQDQIDKNMEFMNNLCSELNKYIEDTGRAKLAKKKKVNTEEDEDFKLSLKKNDRDGYYLSITKLRAKSLQKNLEKIDKIKITDDYTLNTKTLEFKELSKGNTKIFFDDLNTKSDIIIKLRYIIMSSVKEEYIKVLKNFYDKYGNSFKYISQFIAEIDFIKSSAKTAILYNYTKPKLVNNPNINNGYIKCKGLRHPIVERIKTDVEYIPHDIEIGKNNEDAKNIPLEGMLVFGINSAGKSVFMKAVGLSVIMAQCGMFVPATSFEYSPYHSLFARISGNDNIFKGLSSFALEMTELRAILKRTGPHTLIIGDEICRGTEHISGNAIVSASIIKLSQTNSSFIFATHLHEIPKMKRIQELQNVKCFHLTVDYDKKNNVLIFDRKLKEGPGEPIYGITVARYLIHDQDFISLTQEIKNELLKLPNEILTDKTSKYNSKIYIDKCTICGLNIHDPDNLSGSYDTHHINFQKDCENGFVKDKPHILKNSEANLIILCKDCHSKVHHNKLKIVKFLDTSKGKIIDTHVVPEVDTKPKRKKTQIASA